MTLFKKMRVYKQSILKFPH